jgi:hypothetical protein
MPVQKIDPKVMQRMQYMEKSDPEGFRTLMDMSQVHGFTPGDDMSPAIQRMQKNLAAESGTRPGAESLMRDHINALTNLQNMLFNGQDTRSSTIFDPPADPDDTEPYGATLGNPQGVK